MILKFFSIFHAVFALKSEGQLLKRDSGFFWIIKIKTCLFWNLDLTKTVTKLHLRRLLNARNSSKFVDFKKLNYLLWVLHLVNTSYSVCIVNKLKQNNLTLNRKKRCTGSWGILA